MTCMTLVDFLGWYGTMAILSAYALNSFAILDASGLLYQLLNGTGALGIVVVSLKKKAWQPALLNLVWMVIAAIVLLRLLV